MLAVPFDQTPIDIVKKYASYRLLALSSKTKLMEERMETIYEILKEKNPALLVQIQKTPATNY